MGFIREQKNNYDFFHFPCQTMTPNRVYGIVGTFAHNMIRFLSLCMDQKVKRVRGKDKKLRKVIQLGYFAKKVRNYLIKIPCQVVRSARKMKIKINFQTKEVVEKIMDNIEKYFSKVSAYKT